jgi:hypothetical protein
MSAAPPRMTVMFLVRLSDEHPRLFEILGGPKAMIESPLLKELIADITRKAHRAAMLRFLIARFGPDARKLRTALGAIEDDKRLEFLVDQCGRSPDLESFKKLLKP